MDEFKFEFGSSEDRNKEKAIDVLAWSWGISSAEPGDPAFTGTVEFEDGTTIEFVDFQSPSLALAFHEATSGGASADDSEDGAFILISAVERGSRLDSGREIYQFEVVIDGEKSDTVQSFSEALAAYNPWF